MNYHLFPKLSKQWKKVLLISPIALGALAASAAETLRWRSTGIEVEIAADGRLLAIGNPGTKETYTCQADESAIRLATETIALDKISWKQLPGSREKFVFIANQGGLRITRTYRFPAGRAYFDRELVIQNTNAFPVVIKQVKDLALTFSQPFGKAVFHDDNLVYQTALNVFLRTARGGLCAGIRYPFFRPEVLSTNCVRLSYDTNFRLAPGEQLELPSLFCGVYTKSGFVCRKAIEWKPPIVRADQEEMDLAEVRAMQAIMRDWLPEYPCVVNGYQILLNCWMARGDVRGRLGDKEAQAYHELADQAKMSGCIDVLAGAAVWLGWGEYQVPIPEIDAVGEDARFPMTPQIDRVMKYIRSLGLGTSGFCEPTSAGRHYRKDRPDWKIQPGTNANVRANDNCHANPAYEDWFYRLNCSAIDQGGLSTWAWDAGWFPNAPWYCYDATHGHEPGYCRFQAYRNITTMVRKLRERYPNLFVQICWGLKEAGSWALRGINEHQHMYENSEGYERPGTTLADDLRFQCWYSHNYRFLPTYMNMMQITMPGGTNAHLYSVLSSMSAGVSAGLATWPSFKTQADADRVFATMRTWKSWATKNIEYLKDTVDLFGQPCRTNRIDGTAHLIGDRGFIFVFNPWSETHWGSIPLTDWIGLSRGKRYKIEEIASGARRDIGVYEKGDEFVFPIEGKKVLLFELGPTQEKASRLAVPAGTIPQPAFEPWPAAR